jgi:predicted transcriptional regulator
MNEILQFLKKHGERTDREIADALGIPLADMQLQLAELASKNQVMLCQSTKFVKGKEIKATICRIAGFTPPAAPGPKSGGKSKVQLTL